MKDGELIAGYEHNGKKYRIIYYKNSLRCICLDSNGKYYSNFNDEEKCILISVIKGLMVNKNRSRFSGYYNVEDEMYEIYYDLASKNYFWYSSSGVNNVNHNVMLNKLFNDIPDVVYKKDVTDRAYQKFKLKLYKELKRYYGRRLANSIWDENDITRMAMYVDHAKVDKKRGIKKFFVKAGVSLALLAELVTLGNIWKVSIENRDNSFYNSTEYSYVDTQASAPVEFEIEIDEAIVEEKVEYSWDVVKDAIESNPNLTDIEKKFLLELRFVFDECHQYMDLDLVISRLSSLKITYDKNYDVLKSGMYIPSQNEIIIYNSSSFEDADFSTLLHEVCHVFQGFSGHNLLELSNSMFTAECLKKLHLNGGLDRLGHKIYDEFNLTNVYDYYEKGGYFGTRDYYQLLANLLSKETLLQYNFTCNHDLIVNELCFNSVNYREDAIRAYDLLRNIHYCVEEQQKKVLIQLMII